MLQPLQITWRDVPQSDAIESAIRDKAEKLDHFYDGIIACKVLVEASHRKHHKGNLYRIHVVVEVPDREIAVTRDPADEHAHEDIYVSIRDAFDAARRQLQDYAAKRRGQVKQHEPHHAARVALIKPEEDYGFLETPDGREIFFHRNSLVHADFDKLKPGDEVSFVEEEGEQGPQARQVSVGRRH